jgi:hypothetical protein
MEIPIRPERRASMNDRLEAQTALANLLLQKIRQDKYPSSTQMDLLEQFIPRQLIRDYLNVLMEKVLLDNFPSIDMLRRLSRIVQAI